jgi:hypothetical protein
MDPGAPHEGGVMPDLVIPVDSTPVQVSIAALAAGSKWDSLNLAMLDWVQAAADTIAGLTPDFDSDPSATRALLERSGVTETLPLGTEAAVRSFIQDALSRGVVGARFGVMEEGAWGLMHDPEVLRVAAELAKR